MNLISIGLIMINIIFIIKTIKEYKKSKSIDEKVLFCGVGIVIFFPITMFYLDFYNIPSKFGWISKVDSSEWLNIIFTYVVGILSALIGAYMTIRSVKMSIEEQEKVRKNEEKIKALPLLKISPEEQYDYRYKYMQFSCFFTEESKKRKRKDIADTANVTIKLQNVGMRELYDLYIGDIQSSVFKEDNEYHKIYPVIYKDDYVCINLSFYEMGSYDKDTSDEKYHTMVNFMTFNCYFKDCYNNWYYQTLQVSLMYNLNKDVPINERALNISVSNTEIISPPIEIKESDLPWNNGKSLCHHI